MTFTPNLLVGGSIMLLGVVLILDRVGLIEARALLQLWPILLILFGGAVVMQALRRTPDQPASPDDPNRQTDILPLVALLVIVFLFVSHPEARREVHTAPPGMHAASVVALVGRKEHVAPAQPFHGGGITTLMGRSRLDLRHATLRPGEVAVIDVLGAMGRVDVIVPEDWQVDVQTTGLVAAIRTRRAAGETGQQPPFPADVLERPDFPPHTPAPPQLVLRGVVLMGALVVQ